MKNKINKCIVFGGGGFIGSNLCEELVANGYDVTVFEKRGFDKKNLRKIESSLTIFEGDFTNIVDVKNAISGMHYVFHFISATIPSVSMDNQIFDIEANLIPSVYLLQALQKSKTFKKIIFLSSGGTVYGTPKQVPIPETHIIEPISSYGIIKASIERYFVLFNKIYKKNSLVFRLSNPYGQHQSAQARQGVVPIFLKKIIDEEVIEIWGDGSVVRDYINVQDAVKLFVKAIQIDTADIIYNVGSGCGITLNNLINIIEQVVGTPAKINYQPSRVFDVQVNILDIEKVKKDFNWSPEIKLREGIQDLYEQFKKLV
jgi:UDP-glucose 4-epimerase